MACLCSLHSYLLHNDNELYRLRTNDSSHRFCSNPLAVKDEMDVFMQFVAEKTKTNNDFMQYFNDWLLSEKYDWDSIQMDIDCNEKGKGLQLKQSNFYLFLQQHNYQKLFALIHSEYIGYSSVISLNFGKCVLLWFEYAFCSKYKSLMD